MYIFEKRGGGVQISFSRIEPKFKLLNREVIFFFKYKVFMPIIGRETTPFGSRSFSALKKEEKLLLFFSDSLSFFIKEVLCPPGGESLKQKQTLFPAVQTTGSEFRRFLPAVLLFESDWFWSLQEGFRGQ